MAERARRIRRHRLRHPGQVPKRWGRRTGIHRQRFTLNLRTAQLLLARKPGVGVKEDEGSKRSPQAMRELLQTLRQFALALGDDWMAHTKKRLPRTPADCPDTSVKPCRHFLCPHHLAVERRRNGSLRLTWPRRRLETLEHTCVLAFVRANPDGISLAEVGDHTGTNRERVRQIWDSLRDKLRPQLDPGWDLKLHDLAAGLLAAESAPQTARARPERTLLTMATVDEYVIPRDPEAHLKLGVDESAVKQRYAIHEIAQKLPAMSPAEFNALIDDIRAHGQREPIKLYEGKILDGRNRYLACLRVGVEPRVEQWQPVADENPVDYVLSLNVARRHLSESQRAMVAADLKPLYEQEAQKRMLAGKAAANPPLNCATSSASTPGEAVDVVGSVLKVSGESVARATKVLERGVPALAQLVRDDQASVSAAAEVATLPPSRQQHILSRPDPGQAVRTAAGRIRARRKAKAALPAAPVAPVEPAGTYSTAQLLEAHAWVTKNAGATPMGDLLHDAIAALSKAQSA